MAAATDRIAEMLIRCETDRSILPPTALFNEGWMLRLVLDWFARHPEAQHVLEFAAGARWYSEALLPTQFRARNRGDQLAESWTHADGVIGHFNVRKGRGDISLAPDAQQFLVMEAKMFSGLSPGTKRADYFDQAARNVACVAEVLYAAERSASTIGRLGFIMLAPAEQIARGVFASLCAKESVHEKVRMRVAAYDGQKDRWFREAFVPVLERIALHVLAWEDLLTFIGESDTQAFDEMRAFFNKCLIANRPRGFDRQPLAPELPPVRAAL